MLRQEQYQQLASEFQVNVGIVEWNGGPIYEIHTKDVRKIPDDLKVMILTQWIIRKGVYQQVHRELYRLEKKYKNRRIKESTLYHKALDIVVDREGLTID